MSRSPSAAPAKSATSQGNGTKQRPVREIRLGSIVCAVWENETEQGVRFNFTFSRLYKDAEGRWKNSSSFGVHDLPLLVKVADLAHTSAYSAGEGEG